MVHKKTATYMLKRHPVSHILSLPGHVSSVWCAMNTDFGRCNQKQMVAALDISVQTKIIRNNRRVYIRDGSRFSNIRLVNLIIEYRLGCATIF